MAGKGFRMDLVADAAQFIAETGKVENQLEAIAQGMEEMARDASSSMEKAEKALEGVGDEAEKTAKEIDSELSDAGKDAGKEIADEMDDAEKAIKALGDEAGKTGKEIGSEIDQGAEKAEDSISAFKGAAARIFDAVEDDARRAGGKIGSEISDGADRAGEGMSELKDEAGQSGREAAASFSGEFDDITDLVQEIAANAFIGFGPAGAAAGMAAAAGIGLLITSFNNAKEEAEQLQERFESLVDALTEGNIDAAQELIDEQMKNIVKSTDDAIVSMEEFETIMKAVEGTGISQEQMLRALGGDQGAIALVTAQLDPLITKERQWATANEQYAEANQGRIDLLLELAGKLDSQSEAHDRAAESAEVYQDATKSASDMVKTHAESLKALVDRLQEEIDLRAEAAEMNRNYAQIVADQDDALRDATEAIAENNEEIANSTQLGIENKAVLADLADELLNESEAAAEAGIKGQELSEIKKQNYDDFLRTAEAAGLEGEEIRQLAEDFGLLPHDVDVPIDTPGYGQAIDNLRRFDRQARGLPANVGVAVDFRVPDLQRVVNRAAWNVRAAVAVDVYANVLRNWWG